MATELRERKRLRAELESVMVRRGLRSTSQRRLILDRLFEIGEHFTFEGLCIRQMFLFIGCKIS